MCLHSHGVIEGKKTKKTMRPIRVAAVLLVSIFYGCEAPMDDVHIREKLVGTCLQLDQFDSGASLQRLTTYFANGTFTEQGKRMEGRQVNHYTVAGLYRIEKGMIYYEVLSSNHPGIAVGYNNVNRIADIDDKSVAMDTPQGKRVVCHWQTNRSGVYKLRIYPTADLRAS